MTALTISILAGTIATVASYIIAGRILDWAERRWEKPMPSPWPTWQDDERPARLLSDRPATTVQFQPRGE